MPRSIALLHFDHAVVLDGDGHAGLDIAEEFIPKLVDNGHFGIRPHIGKDGAGCSERVDRHGEEHTRRRG